MRSKKKNFIVVKTPIGHLNRAWTKYTEYKNNNELTSGETSVERPRSNSNRTGVPCRLVSSIYSWGSSRD